VSAQPYRCPACGKLLFKSDAEAGQVETFCRLCKRVRTVAVKPAVSRLTPAYRRP
jgi:phage FluMu protein Com